MDEQHGPSPQHRVRFNIPGQTISKKNINKNIRIDI